jgi:hypothetical protein
MLTEMVPIVCCVYEVGVVQHIRILLETLKDFTNHLVYRLKSEDTAAVPLVNIVDNCLVQLLQRLDPSSTAGLDDLSETRVQLNITCACE